MLDPPLQLRLHIHQWPLPSSHGRCQATDPLHDSFNPGFFTATEVTLSPMASTGLSGCKSSASPHDPPCFQNKHHMWDSYKLPSFEAGLMFSFGPFWAIACMWGPWEILPRFHSVMLISCYKRFFSHSWPVLIVPIKHKRFHFQKFLIQNISHK